MLLLCLRLSLSSWKLSLLITVSELLWACSLHCWCNFTFNKAGCHRKPQRQVSVGPAVVLFRRHPVGGKEPCPPVFHICPRVQWSHASRHDMKRCFFSALCGCQAHVLDSFGYVRWISTKPRFLSSENQMEKHATTSFGEFYWVIPSLAHQQTAQEPVPLKSIMSRTDITTMCNLMVLCFPSERSSKGAKSFTKKPDANHEQESLSHPIVYCILVRAYPYYWLSSFPAG